MVYFFPVCVFLKTHFMPGERKKTVHYDQIHNLYKATTTVP